MGDKKSWEGHVNTVSEKMKPDKMHKVLNEFKKGTLNIGKSKKKVKSRKQAIAIGLSMSGKSKKKKR
jgi:hypothetical protein